MVQVRSPTRGIIILSLFALTPVACGGGGSKTEQRKTQISGPIGLEYSVHPLFHGPKRETIAGCCSIAATDIRVRALEGDVDGREMIGPGFRASLNYGGRTITNIRADGATMVNVDGVSLYRFVDGNPAKGEPRFRYWASIPLNAEADRLGVDYPKFEVSGWCDDAQACGRLQAHLATIRF